eukprot:gene5133-6393_t
MYRLYFSDKKFIMRRETLHDKALVIDRKTSKMEIISKNEIDSNLPSRVIYCCLGIFRILGESYLVIVPESKVISDVYQIFKIHSTEFLPFIDNSYRNNNYYSSSSTSSAQEQEERPYSQVMNLLNSGHFYYTPPNSSSKYDITRTFQEQTLNPKSDQPIWDRVDKRFYWNKFLQKDFIAYRLYDWCFPIVQGFVSMNTLGDIQGKRVSYTLVSRRSRFRAGTRFNTRGIDDDGNVANFVETEHIVNISGYGVLSFLQTRGSVPVFWNQSSPQLSDFKMKMSNLGKLGKIGTKKITILRTTQATTPAFQNHFKEQTQRYGNVVIINLLSRLKAGEGDLVSAYEEQCRIMKSPQIHYNHFDLHEQVKGNRMEPLDYLINSIDSTGSSGDLSKVGYFFVTKDGNVIQRQMGTVRTNCKDCLDRTNIVQSRVAWVLFESHLRQLNFLSHREQLNNYPLVAQSLKTMWADNGDALSIQYAGSGSLKSTLTREGEYGIMGMLADGKKTMTRFYINNFKDPGRQDVIDQLLGLHKSVQTTGENSHDSNIRKEIMERRDEFSQKEYRNIFVGTYNVGAQYSFPLDEWLKTTDLPSPDVYVLGLQEIVELSATQILQTDYSLGKQWEDQIVKGLKKVQPSTKYVKLQSEQLVGLYLCIFIREELVHLFREVQFQIIKVGLSGLAGNKGGIGVRLLFNDTSFSFVTAHFAAGQSNVDDRIRDYFEISNQARFGRQGQFKIDDSDYSIWLGDFNFRLDLMDGDIRRWIDQENWQALYDNDQLKKSLERKMVFRGYREDTIAFAPTYKYDLGCNRYDTSPKQRQPAWTDRILWKNNLNHDLRQLNYRRHELFNSDHRPVSSYMQVLVTKVDKEKERQLRQQLYEQKSVQLISKDGATTRMESLSLKSAPTLSQTHPNLPSLQYQPTIPHSQSLSIIPTVSTSTTLTTSVQHQSNNTNMSQIHTTTTTTSTASGVPPRKVSSGRPLPMVPQQQQQQQQQQIIQELVVRRNTISGGNPMTSNPSNSLAIPSNNQQHNNHSHSVGSSPNKYSPNNISPASSYGNNQLNPPMSLTKKSGNRQSAPEQRPSNFSDIFDNSDNEDDNHQSGPTPPYREERSYSTPSPPMIDQFSQLSLVPSSSPPPPQQQMIQPQVQLQPALQPTPLFPPLQPLPPQNPNPQPPQHLQPFQPLPPLQPMQPTASPISISFQPTPSQQPTHRPQLYNPSILAPISNPHFAPFPNLQPLNNINPINEYPTPIHPSNINPVSQYGQQQQHHQSTFQHNGGQTPDQIFMDSWGYPNSNNNNNSFNQGGGAYKLQQQQQQQLPQHHPQTPFQNLLD